MKDYFIPMYIDDTPTVMTVWRDRNLDVDELNVNPAFVSYFQSKKFVIMSGYTRLMQVDTWPSPEWLPRCDLQVACFILGIKWEYAKMPIPMDADLDDFEVIFFPFLDICSQHDWSDCMSVARAKA